MRNSTWFKQFTEEICADEYLYWLPQVGVISVYDDSLYDRSDLDLLSPGMRRHVVSYLKKHGAKQKRGACIAAPKSIGHFWLSKPSVLLATSPYDATIYLPREQDDIYILTPTQTAAYLIDNLPLQEAIAAIESLGKQQPMNIGKLEDYLPEHFDKPTYRGAFTYLRTQQKAVRANSKIKFKRALGSFF
jgi:hypothetical protein